MKKLLVFLITTIALFAATTNCSYARSAKEKKADKALIDKVAQWQMDNHAQSKHHKLDWTNGALYRGMYQWAEYSNNPIYFDYLYNVFDQHDWDFLKRVYHADDLCVAQTYIKMYKKYGNEKMIDKTKLRVDQIVWHPSTARLWHGEAGASDRWSWCDALFMAPPVFVEMYDIFKDEKYLQFVDREYKLTTDSLFNYDYGLYYRDRNYKGRYENNGKDIFWGRGNGWVYAGLTFILETMPKDHYTYQYYMDLYLRMTEGVLKCQDENGSWHASMLDHESFPLAENSGSGFFTYGLAWGVNNGVLKDKQYKQAAINGWNALKSYVSEDGYLKNVQRVAGSPQKVDPAQTEVYGVGAFLLAGSEMMKMRY